MKDFFYNNAALKKLGVKKIGQNCQISKKISIYSSNIKIGNNVRIDDDVCLKGKIEIKSYVHIGRGCTLSGGKSGIFIDEFTAISNYTQIFCSSDTYNSNHVPIASMNRNIQKKNNFFNIINGKIIIGKCCIIGPFNIILPNTNIGSFSTSEPHLTLYKKINPGTILTKNKFEAKKRNTKEINKKLKSLKKLLKNNCF